MSACPAYYVYEWVRPDYGVVFYVGKGKGNRAYRFGRNSHCDRIVTALKEKGLVPSVRIIGHFATEQGAFEFEKERIWFWVSEGELANKTEGGDGVSGLKHSDATKEKMRAAKVGKPGKSGTTGMKFSEETKAKMRAAKVGKRPNNFGKTLSEETRAKMSASRTGLRRTHIQVVSEETRLKLSASAKAQWQDPNRRPRRGGN